MKTVTCKEINNYIQKNGGSVSIDELTAFLSKSDRVVADIAGPSDDFSLIDWLKAKTSGTKNIKSLCEGFKEFNTAYGWPYARIKAKFIKEVNLRKCDTFSLTRCIYSSLSQEEKDILPFYRGVFYGYIIFR